MGTSRPADSALASDLESKAKAPMIEPIDLVRARRGTGNRPIVNGMTAWSLFR